MADANLLLATLGACLIGIALASFAALRGWRDWLELKRLELAAPARPAGGRIELAALRERVRRLEAIVDGQG